MSSAQPPFSYRRTLTTSVRLHEFTGRGASGGRAVSAYEVLNTPRNLIQAFSEPLRTTGTSIADVPMAFQERQAAKVDDVVRVEQEADDLAREVPNRFDQ